VCGADTELVKFYIVPKFYRTHFPREAKCYTQHDVVLTCARCHGVADVGNYSLRRAIALETGTVLEVPSERPSAQRSELDGARKAAIALMGHRQKLPEPRRAELLARVARYVGRETLSDADIAAVAAERGAGGAGAGAAAGDGGGGDGGGGPAEALLAPGADVVAMLISGAYDGRAMVPGGGAPGGAAELEARLTTFVRRWRLHFVAHNRPSNLPQAWSVEYPVCVKVCAPRPGRFDSVPGDEGTAPETPPESE
jgi:hypothetical protein